MSAEAWMQCTVYSPSAPSTPSTSANATPVGSGKRGASPASAPDWDGLLRGRAAWGNGEGWIVCSLFRCGEGETWDERAVE